MPLSDIRVDIAELARKQREMSGIQDDRKVHPSKIESTPLNLLLPTRFLDALAIVDDTTETAILIRLSRYSNKCLINDGFWWPKELDILVDGPEQDLTVNWTLADRAYARSWIRIPDATAFLLVSDAIRLHLIRNGWLHEESGSTTALTLCGWFHSAHGWQEMGDAIRLCVTGGAA